MDRLSIQLTDLHVPQLCAKCNGRMIFRGVGEYQCEKCGFFMYDDYGKIRNCVEEHPGVTILEAEQRTGVSQRTIRKLLKDGRIMLTEDSKVMLQCEECGKKIRYGRLCPECEKKARDLKLALEKRRFGHNDMHGYALRDTDESKGEKRYRNNG